jgi:hypothetical protein
MLLEKLPDRFTVDLSSAQPLPEVLGGEDVLINRLSTVPTCEQVLDKRFQNRAKRVLTDSPSDARTAE